MKKSQPRIHLIKLGGSVITDKDIPMSVRTSVLKRLASEIAQAKQKMPASELFLIGHGQGSFAHLPATKYQTMKGFINEESVLGMAIVQDNAAQLNRLVVHELIRQQLPAVSFYASNSLVTHERQACYSFDQVLYEYLHQGLIPVTGGDVLVDQAQGCTIWSTEEILTFWAKQFVNQGWQVASVIHVTEVAGVLDATQQVIPEITTQNLAAVKKDIFATKGFDVTGGMMLKIDQSVELAQLGISSKILSGLKPGNLFQGLINGNWQGTLIK